MTKLVKIFTLFDGTITKLLTKLPQNSKIFPKRYTFDAFLSSKRSPRIIPPNDSNAIVAKSTALHAEQSWPFTKQSFCNKIKNAL
jgi:hypothetical protein